MLEFVFRASWFISMLISMISACASDVCVSFIDVLTHDTQVGALTTSRSLSALHPHVFENHVHMLRHWVENDINVYAPSMTFRCVGVVVGMERRIGFSGRFVQATIDLNNPRI